MREQDVERLKPYEGDGHIISHTFYEAGLPTTMIGVIAWTRVIDGQLIIKLKAQYRVSGDRLIPYTVEPTTGYVRPLDKLTDPLIVDREVEFRFLGDSVPELFVLLDGVITEDFRLVTDELTV